MVDVEMPKQSESSVGRDVWIVGDSWASKMLRDSLKEMLPDRRIETINMPGAKSRDVLVELSKSPVLRDPQISQAIILVGTNDSNGHDGPDFYKHHVKQIKDILEKHGKTPIFVEIPDYKITLETSPDYRFAIKRITSVFIFDSGQWDNRENYRKELRNLGAKIVTPPSRSKTPELYRDYLHLNEQGTKVLASSLVAEIQ